MAGESHEGEDLEISAGGIVLTRISGETYVALLQREDGSWVLPKGHQERRDKSLHETAIREVSEELGLDRSSIQVEQKLDAYVSDETFGGPTVRKVNQFFVMLHQAETIPLLKPDADHRDARWWKISETLPHMHYAHQRTLLVQTIEQMFAYTIRFRE
jgi:8-oxo-dGTP pyrophosphatase MutT (NUDIX family)